MKLAELTRLRRDAEQLRSVAVDDIPGPERTLLLGYTCDRHTWHVYLRGSDVHLLVYDDVSRGVIRHEKRYRWLAADLVPDKRVYPESCDLAFARLLTSHGVELSFTAFNEDRYARVVKSPFHGTIYDSSVQGLAVAEGAPCDRRG
ncbi:MULTISPECIES: hypothetical protein [Streptomyces]|uniref:Uncharacterized protein n=1 Tax=Streptomyces prasinus TaxID=67345 RepID=A0ABX6AP02_9ACTN|nr:hypothetical protein [Streptomyces prasinus]QEV04436.1 hypothetical protein CP972_00280 [Streptomyces prasinus]